LRLAHFHLKFKAVLFTRYQIAKLHACAGADGNLAGMALAYQVSRDAAGAIAGNLRLAAIRINQARLDVGIRGGKEPFNTVCANAIVAVANAFAELMQVGGSVCAIHDEEIISAGGSFSERDLHPNLCPTREWFPDDSDRPSGVTDPLVLYVRGVCRQPEIPVFHLLPIG
jgi:hypothetical protein